MFKLVRRFAPVLLSGCLCLAQTQSKGDLSRLVVVGDSLSAGFQNFSLLDTQQVHGYASLIATQAGVPLTLPLVPFPGIPNVLQLVSLGPPPVIAPAAGTLPPIPRDFPTQQPTNLAVPGATVSDALNKRPGGTVQTGVDAMANVILGFPTPFIIPGPARSEVEQAVMLNPTTTIVWLGSNDVLLAELTGDFSYLTPIPNFAASYEQVLDALAKTKTKLVVANIPDVTVIPFLTSAQDVAKQAGQPFSKVGPALGLGPGDFIRLSAQPFVAAILSGQMPGPLPANCPAVLLPGLPVTQVPCVLRAADAATLRFTVLAFNAIIAVEAAFHGAAVVDIHSLIDQIADNGYMVGNKRLTLDFLGGIISLDTMHPTNTGYAIFANEFIKTMNRALHTSIPSVSVEQVAAQDPLVFGK